MTPRKFALVDALAQVGCPGLDIGPYETVEAKARRALAKLVKLAPRCADAMRNPLAPGSHGIVETMVDLITEFDLALGDLTGSICWARSGAAIMSHGGKETVPECAGYEGRGGICGAPVEKGHTLCASCEEWRPPARSEEPAPTVIQ